MDAHKALISDIFNGLTLIEIPFFQRSYVWKEDLWARLIEDMEFVVKTKKSHFLGSIILKEGRKPLPGEMFAVRKTVVDGQQRLTTFLIFLKVLCLKTKQVLFDSQFRIRGHEMALRHGKNDIDAFEKTMSMTEAEKINDYKTPSRIIEVYNYFIDHIHEDKLSIMDIIMNTQFVRIDLDADEDEQQIFDTINSLGVNLTTSELLKNYFFSRETVREYELKWAQVFEKDDETKTYWDTEIETGRIKRAMIDIFFDAYFQLFIQDKKYNISNEDKLMYERIDRLSQSYQHFINNYCEGNKNVVLENMREYAECFMRTFRPEQCNMEVPRQGGIERLNVIIFGLKNTTLIPYVLYLVKNIKEQSELMKICSVIESYLMRRMIVHAPTKNYNKLFTSFIRNNVMDADSLLSRLQKNEDATTYIPDDIELQNGFDTSKLINLQTRGIIYLLESVIRPTNSATILMGFNSYSLEHLMPKKWRNNWPACESGELARKRDSVLLTMGNLAIIPQSLNASIRDAEWGVKKSGKGNNPGLTICAGGLYTLSDVLNKNEWNEIEIQKRASWLCEEATKVWKLQILMK